MKITCLPLQNSPMGGTTRISLNPVLLKMGAQFVLLRLNYERKLFHTFTVAVDATSKPRLFLSIAR